MDEAGVLRWISMMVLHSDGYQAGIGQLGHYCNRMTRDEMMSRVERRVCMLWRV
jgi:hypothetical protein